MSLAERLMRLTGTALMSMGTSPSAATASVCSATPEPASISAISAMGCTVPISLLAQPTLTRIVSSVMRARNEIGTVQPIAEIAEMLAGSGVALHTDAVAAEGLVPIDMSAVPVSLMSLSANDIYGPRGLGALYVRKGVQVAPVLLGGGQERGP